MNPRRARGRANGPAGLWRDLPGQGSVPAEDLPPELAANPLSVACPWKPCRAPIRRTCTTHRGKPRKAHPSRIEAANAQLNPAPTEEPT